MQGFVEYLKGWQLHPVVDHFTVALILLAIVVDLVASLVSSRLWLRYMAVTLIVLGALAAAGSNVTGGWEADRVWNNVHGPAKELLKKHAWWGDNLPWAFAALAIWRIGVEFVGFLGRARAIYLLAAIIAGGAIIYQGSLGGDLVYDYGVGTALMSNGTQSPQASSAASPVPTAPIPTVYVPPATPATAPSPAAPAVPGGAPSAAITPSAVATPAAPAGGNPAGSPAAPSPSQVASPEAKSTTL